MSAMTSAQAATYAVPLRSSGAKPRPASQPAAAPKRAATLRLVPARSSSAAKTPFVVVIVTILVGGLLGLLLLNTLVAQDSFALHDLAANGKALEQREQELAKQVQARQAPAALAAQAAALGMVPGGPPAFLELPSGKVLGQAMPGVAPVASTTWTAPRPTAPPATTQVAAKPAKAKPAAPTSGVHP